MKPTVAKALTAVHPRMVAMRGEAVRRKVANPECVQIVGRAIETGLRAANLTRQAAAHVMGYADETTLTRWITGTENPNLAKLLELGPLFRQGFLIGQAADVQGVEVRTVVTLVQRVSA